MVYISRKVSHGLLEFLYYLYWESHWKILWLAWTKLKIFIPATEQIKFPYILVYKHLGKNEMKNKQKKLNKCTVWRRFRHWIRMLLPSPVYISEVINSFVADAEGDHQAGVWHCWRVSESGEELRYKPSPLGTNGQPLSSQIRASRHISHPDKKWNP